MAHGQHTALLSAAHVRIEEHVWPSSHVGVHPVLESEGNHGLVAHCGLNDGALHRVLLLLQLAWSSLMDLNITHGLCNITDIV